MKPPLDQSSCTPENLGCHGGSRTLYLLDVTQALCQVSYVAVVGAEGIEPPTVGV